MSMAPRDWASSTTGSPLIIPEPPSKSVARRVRCGQRENLHQRARARARDEGPMVSKVEQLTAATRFRPLTLLLASRRDSDGGDFL